MNFYIKPINLRKYYEIIMNYFGETKVLCQILYVGIGDGEGKPCEDGIESNTMQLTPRATLRHQSSLELSKEKTNLLIL